MSFWGEDKVYHLGCIDNTTEEVNKCINEFWKLLVLMCNLFSSNYSKKNVPKGSGDEKAPSFFLGWDKKVIERDVRVK